MKNRNNKANEIIIDPDHDPDPGTKENFQSLSFHAMDSTTLSCTMRFTGLINGHSVGILLDGGSDDNFIQSRPAKCLHLDIIPFEPFNVLVGNGHTLQVEGLIQKLQIQAHNHCLQLPACCQLKELRLFWVHLG